MVARGEAPNSTSSAKSRPAAAGSRVATTRSTMYSRIHLGNLNVLDDGTFLRSINVPNLWNFDMLLSSVDLGDFNVLADRNILNSINVPNL